VKRDLLLFLILISSAAFGQNFRIGIPDLSLEQDFPLVSRKPVRDPNFRWDMNGPIQVQINDGLGNFDGNHLELALKNFQEAVKIDPSLWLGYYLMGITHETQKNYKAAVKDYERALDLVPANADVHLALGIVYYEAGGFSQAIKEYQKAVDLNPRLIQGYYNLGVVALTRHDRWHANRFFEQCLEINPNFAAAYNTMGYMAYISRKYDDALELLSKALRCDSTFSPSYLLRGFVWKQKDNNAKWLEDWDLALRLNPTSAFLHVFRAFPYITMERYDDAFTDLKKSLESVDVNLYRGAQTALDRQIDLKFAAQYLIHHGYTLPEQTFSSLKKGFCLLIMQQPEKALPTIKAAATEPSAVAYFLEALALERLGQHDSAYVYYDLVARMDKDNFDAFKKRGMYRAALHDFVGAYSDFEQMMRIDKGSYFSFRLRGMIKLYQGEYIGTIVDLTQYLQNDSTDAEVLNLRGQARSKVGDFTGSNKDLQKSAILRPGDPAPLLAMSYNFLALRDTLNTITTIENYSSRMTKKIIRPQGPYAKYFITKIGAGSGGGFSNAKFACYTEVAKVYIRCRTWDKVDKELDSLKDLLWSPNPQNRKEYATLHHLRGLRNFGQHNYKDAIKELSKSSETDPTNYEVRYVLAMSYEMSGQKKKAMDAFKQIAAYADAESHYQRLLKEAR